MIHRIHERIRGILEARPGLTQKGLAERMGLNPAAVNRMLHGQRNIMAEEIPIIEDYLGVKLALSSEMKTRGFGEAGRQEALAPDAPPPLVPVYAGARDGEPVDWVQRHPAQFGLRDAFAVYIFSGEMEPRYFPGEIIYLHPGRPPEPGRDCMIEMNDGKAVVRRLVRQNDEKIRVACYNPAGEKEIVRKNIRAIYAVVGRG